MNSTAKYLQIVNHNIHINWDKISANLIDIAWQILCCSIIFWLILKFGSLLIKHYLHSRQNKFTKRAQTIAALTTSAFRYLVIFFYLFAILSILGLPVGTLIASAGIFSLAIGIGAQGFVSDLVNGFFILSEDQFDVGDIVQIQDNIGRVSQLGLRTTKLQTEDGSIIFIPNRAIKIVRNLTHGGLGIHIDLTLPLTMQPAQATQIIKRVNKEINPNNHLIGKPIIVGIISQDSNSYIFRVDLQVKAGYQNEMRSRYFTKYLKALNIK